MSIRIIKGTYAGGSLPTFLLPQNTKHVQAFHRGMKEYSETPLHSLSNLASSLGVKGIYVKDESHRFGLNAFKALGSSFAANQLLGDAPDPSTVLVTATDGNHGKGVAWTAARLGLKSRIFMPKGTKQCRVDAIAAIDGAHVEVTALNYDATVETAFDYANENGYILMQDTSFGEYREIPNLITQGYATLGHEIVNQLEAYGASAPTHILLQAGVGSMAGALLAYFADYYEGTPKHVILEPTNIACFYASVEKGDGAAHSIGGHQETIMAGLNCGTPNPEVWPLIRDHAFAFAKCADTVSMQGMWRAANALSGDPSYTSGESAGIGIGFVELLLSDEQYKEQRELLGLDSSSVILALSTEGDTDPKAYSSILSCTRDNRR